jgi:hypothetical protein
MTSIETENYITKFLEGLSKENKILHDVTQAKFDKENLDTRMQNLILPPQYDSLEEAQDWVDVKYVEYEKKLFIKMHMEWNVLPFIKYPINLAGRDNRDVLSIEISRTLSKVCVNRLTCSDICAIIESYMIDTSITKESEDVVVFSGHTLEVTRVSAGVSKYTGVATWTYDFNFLNSSVDSCVEFAFIIKPTHLKLDELEFLSFPGFETQVTVLPAQWHRGKLRDDLLKFEIKDDHTCAYGVVYMAKSYYELLTWEFSEMQCIC